jgi:transcriptional regulator with XRE-family HTH domain
MELKDKIKNLRKEKGLTQAQLADALFVSRSTVAKWENGLGLPGPDSIKALEKERKQRQAVIDAYQDALAEAGGDLDKAKEILRAKAEDKTWGDEQIEKANAIYAENKELQGAAKWGGLAASAIPSAAALGLSFLTKGKTAGISKWLNRAAKLAGNVGMAGMSAGTAGLSMIEARQHGATNWETWTTGIADGLIEFITEKIPFDKLTKPVLTAAKTKTTKALVDAMRRVDSPGRKELEKLLDDANATFCRSFFHNSSYPLSIFLSLTQL